MPEEHIRAAFFENPLTVTGREPQVNMPFGLTTLAVETFTLTRRVLVRLGQKMAELRRSVKANEIVLQKRATMPGSEAGLLRRLSGIGRKHDDRPWAIDPDPIRLTEAATSMRGFGTHWLRLLRGVYGHGFATVTALERQGELWLFCGRDDGFEPAAFGHGLLLSFLLPTTRQAQGRTLLQSEYRWIGAGV